MELLEKLAALAPLPRVHLVRYGGCLAPHSHLRGAIIPTLCQQGVDKEATDTGSLCWRWARRLQRVFALWGNNIMSTRENIPPKWCIRQVSCRIQQPLQGDLQWRSS